MKAAAAQGHARSASPPQLLEGAVRRRCAGINALQADLEDAVIDLPRMGVKARFVWKGSQIMPDAAEASAWHGVNRFDGHHRLTNLQRPERAANLTLDPAA
jgi:hypothetical protein